MARSHGTSPMDRRDKLHLPEEHQSRRHFRRSRLRKILRKNSASAVRVTSISRPATPSSASRRTGSRGRSESATSVLVSRFTASSGIRRGPTGPGPGVRRAILGSRRRIVLRNVLHGLPLSGPNLRIVPRQQQERSHGQG